MPKFIPLAFLLSLTIFIIKHIQDNEFVILWTTGVKKIHVANLFFLISVIILVFYLVLSLFITPLALNKSRQLLSNENLNSFLPTVKTQQFSDAFKGFTFIVEKKINNEIKNIFLHDNGNNLKNLSSNKGETTSTTIIAENGLIDEKDDLAKWSDYFIKKNNDSEIIKFEQLNINLSNFSTTTIKNPKIQETSTLKLLSCFKKENLSSIFCNDEFKKEIIPTLNRRVVIPFYIPALALIASLLLIKTEKIYFKKISVFTYCFVVLLFTELAVRYTGINNIIMITFALIPFFLLLFFTRY